MSALFSFLIVHMLYFKVNIKLVILILAIMELGINIKKKKKEFLTLFLSFGILLSAFNNVLVISSFDFALTSSRAKSIKARVISDSSVGKYQNTLNVEVLEATCDKGNTYSAKGTMRVNCSNIKAYTNDIIQFYGKVTPYGFNAKSYKILEQSTISKRRATCIKYLDAKIKGITDKERQLSKLLLLGIKEQDNYPLKELSQKSGSAFVLALSGMHLSFLALLIKRLLFFTGKRNSKIISMLLITFYVIVVGSKASLLRALLLSYCFTIFKKDKNTTLLATLLLHIALFPCTVSTLASAYSYLALCGIFSLSDYIKNALNKIIYLPPFLSSSISASLAALLYTSHLSYLTFGTYQISIVLTAGAISAITFIYMSIAIFAIFFPFLLEINHYCYIALEKLMTIGAKAPQCTSLLPLLILFILITILLIWKKEMKNFLLSK